MVEVVVVVEVVEAVVVVVVVAANDCDSVTLRLGSIPKIIFRSFPQNGRVETLSRLLNHRHRHSQGFSLFLPPH